MRISRSATYAVGVVVAAALLAGCSSSGSPSSGLAPSAGMNSNHVGSPLNLKSTFIGVKQVGNIHTNHHKSWVSPDAARAPRLYFASDYGSNTVDIYTMPGMAMKGQLTGFSGPQGECADTHGNIWIANTNTLQVFEYSRTGTLLNTINDSYGYPAGCAVDPATGNLAVTNIIGVSGAGQVLVYTSPSSSPTVLTNPSQYEYFFAGYGPGSSLWVDGRTSSGAYIMSGCGASSCSTIPLSGGTIYFPGAVQWDGVRGTWVAFDQLCGNAAASCSYPVSASGVLGAATTYSNYNSGAVCDMVQGVIAANGKNYVAGGDYEYCGTANTTVNRFAYPAGGNPTNNSQTIVEPIGAAISTK